MQIQDSDEEEGMEERSMEEQTATQKDTKERKMPKAIV